MSQVVVIKRNLAGREVFRYSGEVVTRSPQAVLVEARFSRPDLPFHGLTFGQGDRMLEAFYAARWFNIFQIHDRADGALKGWYCNIALPAELEQESVSFIDLALDLLVLADGRQLVLDEDEFAALNLDEARALQARAALADLQGLFARSGGFDIERDWKLLIADC